MLLFLIHTPLLSDGALTCSSRPVEFGNKYDVLFLIDTSTSMHVYLPELKIKIRSWIDDFTSNKAIDAHFGLIEYGGPPKVASPFLVCKIISIEL